MTKLLFLSSKVILNFQKAILIAILALFCLSGSTNIALAQQGTIEVWNSNITWAGQGYMGYIFSLDVQGLSIPNDPQVTNFVIQTNYGDINFEQGFNSSDVSRYPEGSLMTQDDIEQIRITKAFGVVNGKMVDFTRFLAVRDFKPVRITINAR